LDSISSIEFHFEKVIVQGLDFDLIRGWIENTIAHEGHQAGIMNFVFCDDEYLLELNKTYLNHFTLTDIITFDYAEEMEGISGDIFISVPRVEENALKHEVAFHEELCRVMIHGVLHLLGYKDKTATQKSKMRDKENYYLSLLS
jgi:probable rRNA maturation factor